MKLSEQSLNLLKNFASINQNIQFKTGNKLTTISPQKNILASVEIPESFPSDFAIYDLNKMLGVMSLFQDPELEIGDKTMNIGGKVEYTFADPAMIVVPPEDKKLEFPNTDVKFKLSKADFDQTIKAASVLGLPHVCFAGNGQAIQIVATDVNNSSSDEFKSEVGVTPKNFNMVYKIENLKLFSGDYDVALTPRITKFSHTSTNLQYYIASESDSTFEG